MVERSKPDLHGLLEGMFSLEENSAKTNTFVNFFYKYKIFIKMVWQLGHKCKKKCARIFSSKIFYRFIEHTCITRRFQVFQVSENC